MGDGAREEKHRAGDLDEKSKGVTLRKPRQALRTSRGTGQHVEVRKKVLYLSSRRKPRLLNPP